MSISTNKLKIMLTFAVEKNKKITTVYGKT